MPEQKNFEASLEDTTINLVQGPLFEFDFPRFEMELGAWFKVSSRMPISTVYDTWVTPLRELLCLLTMRHVSITHVSANLVEPHEEESIEITFGGQNAKTAESPQDQVSSRMDMLATHGRLESANLPFESLLQSYFRLWASGHAAAISYINESETANVDRSAISQLINAVKALEVYDSASGNVNGKLNSKIKAALEGTAIVGEKIDAMWKQRSRRFHTLIPELRNLAAHGERSLSNNEHLDIWSHAVALRWIMRDVYLSELGLHETQVKNILEDCRPFQNEMEFLKRHCGG